MGHYVDTFAFGSPLEIRNDNDAFNHIVGQWVYPRIIITDTIKRNGFNTSTYQMHPVTLFQQLQTNPKAETLMKAYNIEMVRYLCHHPAEVERYWNSIKIAKRAGCMFNEPSMWFDYIKMLERMGRTSTPPHCLPPKTLKQHTTYMLRNSTNRGQRSGY